MCYETESPKDVRATQILPHAFHSSSICAYEVSLGVMSRHGREHNFLP